VIELWHGLLSLLGTFLAFFYSVVPSYGIAIILLTVLVRLVLFPVTAKQAKSMMAMQQVAPEIKRLQAQYKDDRQKLNEEMMKFYKENKINPAAGCLPLVLQMPIFIALFGVLRNAYKHVPVNSKLFKAFCAPHESVKRCAPKFHDVVKTVRGKTTTVKELVPHTGPKGLRFLGMDLSKSAGAHHAAFTDALPYFLLVGLVILTGYLQQRQMQGRQGAAANPQAQMMGYIFPVFFGLISLRLPAGVVVYFFVSNLWQMGQQALVYRNIPPGGPTATSGPADGAAKGKDDQRPKGELTGGKGADKAESKGEDKGEDADPRGADTRGNGNTGKTPNRNPRAGTSGRTTQPGGNGNRRRKKRRR